MVGRRNSMLAVMAGAAFMLQAGLATGAAAQGNTQLAVAPRVFKSFSIADMQSMMEELGFTILAMGAAQDPNSGELAAVTGRRNVRFRADIAERVVANKLYAYVAQAIHFRKEAGGELFLVELYD